jgi:predicted alpha/beta hydrolase
MRQATEEDPTQDRGYRLNMLSNALLKAVELLSPGEDPARQHLDLIDGWLAEAFPLLGPSAAAMCRSSQGLAMLQRFRHFRNASDWTRSSDLLEEARDMAVNDADRAACIGNIGLALSMRYNDDRDPQTAAALVAAYDTAANLSPTDDPNHEEHVQHQRYAREMFGLDTAF